MQEGACTGVHVADGVSVPVSPEMVIVVPAGGERLVSAGLSIP